MFSSIDSKKVNNLLILSILHRNKCTLAYRVLETTQKASSLSVWAYEEQSDRQAGQSN